MYLVIEYIEELKDRSRLVTGEEFVPVTRPTLHWFDKKYEVKVFLENYSEERFDCPFNELSEIQVEEVSSVLDIVPHDELIDPMDMII
jgi:hypothetical protein